MSPSLHHELLAAELSNALFIIYPTGQLVADWRDLNGARSILIAMLGSNDHDPGSILLLANFRLATKISGSSSTCVACWNENSMVFRQI